MYSLFISLALAGLLSFALHISNGGSFPKPLSQAEEAELVRQMHRGSAEARNKLIEHNLRLVAHIVKRFSGTSDPEDLVSIGTIGLIKAVESFSAEKETKLGTYAARCIENAMLSQWNNRQLR